MYMYNWFTLLYIWDEHNIVSQLHYNIFFKCHHERQISQFGFAVHCTYAMPCYVASVVSDSVQPHAL